MTHDIENVIDDLQQMAAAEMDIRDIAPIRVTADRAQYLRLHQVGEADDGIERGAQLVAHISEEIGFGFAGGFGPQLGRLQLFDPPPQLVVPGG
jgi:hypothetical protein